MMQEKTLTKEAVFRGNLLLVNAQHPLRAVDPRAIIPVSMYAPSVCMHRDAANALQMLFGKIGSGDSIAAVSGYRSTEEQTDIYKNSCRENGKTFTRKYVALPNHSEHQTGLAIDVGLKQDKIDFIRPNFPNSGICRAFRESAADFGFILRYPKAKEHVTGIAYEPWHFRYVGHPHAKIMEENGMTLEEYTEFIKQYRADRRLIYRSTDSITAEIYYAPARSDSKTVSVPDAGICQISGNNVDGFVITVWKHT